MRAQPCLLFFLGLTLLGSGTSVEAEDWPGFRGPGGLATIPDGDNGVLSSLSEESLLWKVASGSGHSSPAISGGSLFLSSAEDGGRTLVMTAYRCSDGGVRWQHRVPGTPNGRYGHRAANPAAPTPCVDGKRVYFYFGGYGIIAREIASGALAWERKLAVRSHTFGTGSSPILHGDLLVLNRDGWKEAAILGISTSDGRTRWEIPRPGFRTTYATPFVWKNSGRTEIVVPGMLSLRSYDPADGSLHWSVDDLCVFPCTTPVAGKNRLFFAAWATPNADAKEQRNQIFWGDIEVDPKEASDPDWFFKRFDKDGDGRITRKELPPSRARDVFNFVDVNGDDFWSKKEYARVENSSAPGRNILVAVDAGSENTLIPGKGLAWTYEKGKALPYVSSPLLLNGRLYLVKTGGVLTCLDASTGETVYGPRRCGVSGEYYASPVAWGDKVILCAQRGVVLVLKDAEELSIEKEYDLGEEIYASPAVVGQVLYLRSRDHLWAFGKAG